MINSSIMRELAELDLPAEALQKVIKIIAAVQEGEEQRREDGRQRTRKWREGQQAKRHGDVTDNNSTESIPVKRHGDCHDPSYLLTSIDKPLTEVVKKERVSVAGQRLHVWPRNYQELFWDAYPRKVAKKDALKALDAVCKSDEIGFAAVLAAVSRIDVKDLQFVPYPATWLRRGCYLDVLPASTDGPSLEGLEILRKAREYKSPLAGEYHGKTSVSSTNGRRIEGSDYQEEFLSEGDQFH